MDIRWHVNTLLIKTAVKLLKVTGWYSEYWKHWRGKPFEYAQDNELHIMPVHFYSPVPDTRMLSIESQSTADVPLGIDLNYTKAEELLRELHEKYSNEYTQFPKQSSNRQEYYLTNTAYSSVDAEYLYSLIRDTKPKKIIEIGAGMTTLLISQAIRKNVETLSNYVCEFVSIEPYPPEYLNPIPAEVTRLEQKKLQQISTSEFTSLESGDILFIDSSHVVKIGSDVVYEYLTILPLLKPGVLIHIHDIFIPMDYPEEWINNRRFFWNEQYLLQAFLAFNNEFEVILPMHAMSVKNPKLIEESVPSYNHGEHFPSSFWIKRI